ncbi:glutathione S-transferase family protein [Paraburkholderia domus]|jgi:Glutathione S-transferase|uniref:glutathione S-transferase family protein n=1 Tax=Paraburkholderia domus TaxID=2793075 RepID=UPI001EEFCA0B|nr:glutathione S-transferase domain-containing protein [Paraburkholderia domus]
MPARQTDVVRWLSWNSQHFYRHAGSLYFEHIIKPAFGLGEPDPSKVAEGQGWFRKHAGVLDQHLKGRQWLLGDGLTIADFSVATHAERGRRSSQLRNSPARSALTITAR